MAEPPLFTFFTCTYNRADLLPRLHESICAQTLRDFEWVVFDNGSTDGTLALLERWRDESDFPMKVLHRDENGPIQRAANEGLKVTEGRFWLNLDSDDTCVPHALERFHEIWNTIPEDARERFAGVTVCCEDQHGRLVGLPVPTDPLDSTSQELLYRHKVVGEKWGFNRTDVMRRFPFPDVDHHVNFGIVWRAIGREYLTRFTNDRLRIYYIDESGREDQLSHHQSVTPANVYGRHLNSMDTLNSDLETWFRAAPRRFFEQAIVYSWFSNHLGIGLGKQLARIRPPLGKLLVLLAWPAGKLLYLRPQLGQRREATS